MKYYAGIELEETFVKCCIIARDGTLLCRDKIQGSGEAIADCASKLIAMLTQRANVPLSGIGIVMAKGDGEEYGTKDEAVAFLAEKVQERFPAPVLLIGDFNVNDFNAAVFGD